MDTPEEAWRSKWVLKSIAVTIAQADSEMRPYSAIQIPVRDSDLPAYFSSIGNGGKATFRRVLQKAVEDIFGSISHLEDGASEAGSTTFTLVSDGFTVYGTWMVVPRVVRNGGKR